MNPDPAIVELRETLLQRLAELADEATHQILTEIPAYHRADRRLRSDVHAHVLSHLQATLESLGADRDVTRDDLLFVRPHAARRATRVPIAEFVRAFYVGERVLWDAALALARDDDSRRAALAFASHLPRYFEVATTHAAEVYLETEQELAATGERIRRDLLEDLLAGREVEPGPRLDAAQAAGLGERSPLLVISAAPSGSVADEHLLRGGAAALGRASDGRTPALAVLRQDEIVALVAAPKGTQESLPERLQAAQRRLADAGLALSIGVSTTVDGLARVPDAYREACTARASQPGVVALSEMNAFQYLTMRPDPTAGRLIDPAIHEFVEQDARDGGPLIATLRQYVASDLNARRAADRLHIHVNTAHYRLGRIAERTGCDLRRVGDLIEILIAARLHDATATD